MWEVNIKFEISIIAILFKCRFDIKRVWGKTIIGYIRCYIVIWNVYIKFQTFFPRNKIFENGRLSHFVDGRGAPGNWMSLVKCARFPEEQNLTAVQCEGQIYYEACKEIRAGQELLVWYGDCYVQFLGIPLTLKEFTDASEALPAEGMCAYCRCIKIVQRVLSFGMKLIGLDLF